ncbi:glycosyltransferase family 2 protein [Laspinema olomoucense]|uniref:glycosyltransferase family 2 protein n=1 Tax=Laspinema olomoucense TaxID=3231600 RepID=UPI0021BA5110|nr:glycosyltransferase family A protein [Laspinema sp. D3d]MCT7974884.1 glycosyltransferase family 2 protein [Laspinema sp. D3d]
MTIRFSLIYPTRHRPIFIKHALLFLENQKYQDFEVIVSDNYSDPNLSCKVECEKSDVKNLKYICPPKPVGMVENWNYALQFATGDYICYLTDKMFLLPHTLSQASIAIEKESPEIVTWIDNSYSPSEYPDYFGSGYYYVGRSMVPLSHKYLFYDPLEELSKKGRADCSRSEQTRSNYARGKICFGAYSALLCERIIHKSGNLFHNMSPDYSSMILALSWATSALELSSPGFVHINTDLSNGGQAQQNDQFALSYIKSLEKNELILDQLLIPSLYSSANNLVAHDYLLLKNKFNLEFEFDKINWLVYITEDLNFPDKIWSSLNTKEKHLNLLHEYLENFLPETEKLEYLARVKARTQAKKNIQRKAIKKILKLIIPNAFLCYCKEKRNAVRGILKCSAINEILINHKNSI